MIMRILHPDSGVGHLRVLGEESSEAANDRVGYLPEERGLYKKMTVRAVLRFYAELKGCSEGCSPGGRSDRYSSVSAMVWWVKSGR